MTGTELRIDLGPTRTYAGRVAYWLPLPAGGLLTLELSRTAGGKLERDRYDCEEQETGAAGVREWLLKNLDDDEQPDVYSVVVGNGSVTCTCPGSGYGHRCKHAAAFLRIASE